MSEWGRSDELLNRHQQVMEKCCSCDNSLMLVAASEAIIKGVGEWAWRGRKEGLKVRRMVDQLIKKLYFGIDLLVSFLSCVSHAEHNVLYCTFINICPVFVVETRQLQHIWSCWRKHINTYLICDTSKLLVENWLSSWFTGGHKSLPLWLY